MWTPSTMKQQGPALHLFIPVPTTIPSLPKPCIIADMFSGAQLQEFHKMNQWL
jgi:hypothetical protein